MSGRGKGIATGKARLMERLRAKAAATSAPPIDELSIACVGARFANPRRKGQPTGNREMEIMFAKRGDPVELRPEPENKADEAAIAVYSKGGVQIGYISADRTMLLHRAWGEARDVHALFQQRTPWGAWIRIGFDREPTMPPEAEPLPVAPAQVADFYPDNDPGFDGVDFIPPDD